eukprot:7645143-Pyramimonas_sp.AAC.1
MASHRTPGCDLDDAQANIIFDQNVKLATCSPKSLWALDRVTKGGHTSDWPSVRKSFDELHAILLATGGLIPHQQ